MEFLKEYLGEELYSQVAKKLKDNDKVKLANLAEGQYVAKGKFEAMEAKVTALTNDLAGRDTDLADLQKKVGKSDTLKADLEALQVKYTEATASHEKDLLLADIKFDIIEYGANDVIGAMAHVDVSKISRVEGKLVGLNEQLDPIKAKYPNNFGSPKENFESNPPNPSGEETPTDDENLSDDEFFSKKMAERNR